MIAVAVLGAGALLVTIYATEQRVRVDQQLPDRVGDVSGTTAAVNRVNEELYRTNAELLLLIETVEATNIELVLVIETVEATNAELLRVIETLERNSPAAAAGSSRRLTRRSGCRQRLQCRSPQSGSGIGVPAGVGLPAHRTHSTPSVRAS